MNYFVVDYWYVQIDLRFIFRQEREEKIDEGERTRMSQRNENSCSKKTVKVFTILFYFFYNFVTVALLIVVFVRFLWKEYAQVTKMLGNGRVEAMCFDGAKRLCHIRGKLRKKVFYYAELFLTTRNCSLRTWDVVSIYYFRISSQMKLFIVLN